MPAEITSYCFYPGNDRTYMVANAIFRMVSVECVCVCVCVQLKRVLMCSMMLYLLHPPLKRAPDVFSAGIEQLHG